MRYYDFRCTAIAEALSPITTHVPRQLCPQYPYLRAWKQHPITIIVGTRMTEENMLPSTLDGCVTIQCPKAHPALQPIAPFCLNRQYINNGRFLAHHSPPADGPERCFFFSRLNHCFHSLIPRLPFTVSPIIYF